MNLTGNDADPEFAHRLAEPISRGTLTVNLRAEGDPEALAFVLNAALAREGIATRTAHAEAFRPGRPVPTHRLATA